MTAAAPTTPPASADALFAEIHRDHLGIIMKITLGFVARPADRDDLFQEILIALWQALPRFNAQARVSTYVYRVALSTALNWKRSQTRYGRKLDDYTQALPALAPAPGPEQERLRWLYARIHELPPVDRSLILLSLDRLNYGEIAAITGLSESNVGVRLHRIKQQLVLASEKIKHEL
ncbi:MAG: RNA polymerase sigma factor [Verrucomicrobiota bacterium]